jgi:amidophosphoribosyltransferase
MRQPAPFDDDKLHEECGVFGIFGHPQAAALTTLGLHALQHRGQEGAGIVSYDAETGRFHSDRRKGLVGDSFSREDIIESLKGESAIGHVRYSTAGGSIQRNVQPLFAGIATGGLALAHNGNLTNSSVLRDELVAQGAIFQSTSDTECILHLIATARQPTLVDRLSEALRQVEGAYSLVALSNDMLVGVRDPLGVRPLVLGELDGAYILASETCALDIIGAEFIRDIEAGEIITITRDGVESFAPFPPMRKRFCIFELVYFAGAASAVEGHSVYEVRRHTGAELARESPVAADVVVPVPDSAVAAAIGYAEESGIPFEFGIIKNNYVGRTFIEPEDSIRHLGVKLKHNANRAVIAGRRVILVDDSIVRGTTSKKIVEMVREAGAKEVHMRIASPPTSHSCFYGVDTPERSKLLAARMDLADMADFIGVDSLAYVTIDGLYRAVGEAARNKNAPQYCDACFTGDYPTPLTDRASGATSMQLSLLTERAW